MSEPSNTLSYSEIHPLLESSFFMLTSTKTANYQKAESLYLTLLESNPSDLSQIYLDQINIYTYLNKPEELQKAFVNYINSVEYSIALPYLKSKTFEELSKLLETSSSASNLNILKYLSETSDYYTFKLANSENSEELYIKLYEKYISTIIACNLRSIILKHNPNATLKDSCLPSTYADESDEVEKIENYLKGK